MARDYPCRTLDPRNPAGPKIDVILPGWWTLKLYKEYPVDYENLRAVKRVLENPERIFSGVREFNEGYWCYTGRPEEWYMRERVIVPFPRNRVFAVYVNARMQVYEFRAEYAAHDDPLSPRDWQRRYRGVSWKSTSSPT